MGKKMRFTILFLRLIGRTDSNDPIIYPKPQIFTKKEIQLS